MSKVRPINSIENNWVNLMENFLDIRLLSAEQEREKMARETFNPNNYNKLIEKKNRKEKNIKNAYKKIRNNQVKNYNKRHSNTESKTNTMKRVRFNIKNKTNNNSSGGSKKKTRKPKVHTGPRGGKYIMRKGKKVYV